MAATPASSVQTLHPLVRVCVPDAGSVMARLLGRRWWSVLPMHLQYFTRTSVAQLLDAHGFQVRSVRTHAKTFSLRYYLERLEGYSTTAAGAAVRAAERAGWAERLVTPNLREFEQGRRLSGERLLAQLRRTPRNPEHAVDPGLIGRVWQ